MVDNQLLVGVALFADSDSYSNILKFGTPYVQHSVYMHVCIHTVLPVAKVIYPVSICC
jgi:hypothetical protein